jgi:hypothetical protein
LQSYFKVPKSKSMPLKVSAPTTFLKKHLPVLPLPLAKAPAGLVNACSLDSAKASIIAVQHPGRNSMHATRIQRTGSSFESSRRSWPMPLRHTSSSHPKGRFVFAVEHANNGPLYLDLTPNKRHSIMHQCCWVTYDSGRRCPLKICLLIFSLQLKAALFPED